MNPKERNEVGKLYHLLRERLDTIDGSIFLKIVLKSNKTIVRKIIKECSVSTIKLSRELIDNLVTKGYIQRNPDEYYKYCITAKGIWLYENKRRLLNTEKFLEHINHEYLLGIPRKREINDQGKVLIFGLLLCRFLSEDCPLQLDSDNVNSTRNKNWYKILMEIKSFLSEVGAISPKKLPFEDKVDKTYLMKRLNELPNLMYGLYVREKANRIHHLALTDRDGSLNKNKIYKTFKILFGSMIINPENILSLKSKIKSYALQNRHKVSDNYLFLESESTNKMIQAFDSFFL